MTQHDITPTRHGMTGHDIMQHDATKETWNDVKSDDMT